MNPFTQNNPYPLYSLTKLNVFCSIGNVKWKVTNFISTTKKGAMCNYNATITHLANFFKTFETKHHNFEC
jgi:hypothetical protein